MKALLFPSVVQNDIETARDGDNELLQLLVRMAAALAPARDVVKIIDAFNRKGDMRPGLQRRSNCRADRQFLAGR